MYGTSKKLIGLIVIVVLLVTSLPATLFALSGGEIKTMKVGEMSEIGIDHMWSSENPEIVNIEYRPCPAGEGLTHDYAVAVAPGTAILKSRSMGTAVIKVIPKENREFKIYGYIKPDFQFPADKADVMNSGFRLELINTDRLTVTYTDGYFEFNKVVPDCTGFYTVRIRKNGYLSRYIKISATNGDCELSTIDAPIKMWAGDIDINGVQDNAINMKDIMELATCFNSSYLDSNSGYKYKYDLNDDRSINMVDVMIMAQNFNKSSWDYPEVQVNYIPASTVPTSTPTSTPIPTPTPTYGVQTFKPAATPGTYELNVKVGDLCAVELVDYIDEGIGWDYNIENSNIVSIKYKGNVKTQTADSRMVIKQIWHITAIAEGTSSITFESNKGGLKVYKLIASEETVTITPTPTTPTTPIPTPTYGVQTFKPAATPGTYELNLKVGDLCAVESQDYIDEGVLWYFKIENNNIVWLDRESNVKTRATDSRMVIKRIWYFKAMAEGATSITFESNKGDLKVYNLIASEGTATVTPTPTPK